MLPLYAKAGYTQIVPVDYEGRPASCLDGQSA